ncbi:MAG TPA: NADH-quinone oxidoreductase subunit E, partial [Nocardioides sp.]|nr:NADH-quinone oxidoreductase subunit E [Nocardioides sp.]
AGLTLARENSWSAPSSEPSRQSLGAGAGDPVEEADSNPAEAAAVDESSSATETGAEKDEAK